jgi:hypothetical protein
VASGSSAKKVARLAQKGKGKKVRFQGGTLFPSIMAIVIVLGTALIVYSRQSAPSRNTAPTINDHWHVSYGFYKCDGFLNDLKGTLEEPVTPEYQKYNIHSHDDGVIHWHAGALATGTRAKLGVFLDSYGVKVSTDGITFPANQNNGESYKTSDLKCKNAEGEMVAAQVQVVVWDQYDNSEVSMKYITDFDNIRIKKDGMAITMAIAAPGADIPMPKSAANLPELGAADMGGVTTTTVKGATTTTVKGATTTTAG